MLWRANGCVLAADVTAGPADAPGPGPCSRTEIAARAAHRRSGVVAVHLRCVAAPGRVCHGTAQVLPRSPVRRFAIAAGAARTLRFRARGDRYRVVTVDPGGRRHVDVGYI